MKKRKQKVNKTIDMKNLRNIKKNVNGITLIALIVTIIILLILAGIVLNLSIGENGIFNRAQIAANIWRNAETNEQLAMGELEDWIDDVTPQEPINNEDLQISAENVYYADLDSTGEISVDGVIFADLAGEEESGQWRNSENMPIGDHTQSHQKQD